MLTSREAFKVGFMYRCAEAGMSEAETVECMNKAAALMEKAALPGASAVSGLLGGLTNYGAQAAMLMPLLGGASIGYGLNELSNPDIDEEDVRTKELINEYKHHARQARERHAARHMREVV